MPVSFARASAAATAVSTLSPPSSTVAPWCLVAAILESDAPLGTKISHLAPK